MDKLSEMIELAARRMKKLESESHRMRSALKRLVVLQDRESTGQSNLANDWQLAWDEAARVIME